MTDIFIETNELCKYFKTPRGMLHAVEHVDVQIHSQQTLGVVGESGCGKSTLGRLIVGLHESTAGKISLEGEDITHPTRTQRQSRNRQIQMIFQDPFSSLDPRKCVSDLIMEPMKVMGTEGNKAGRSNRVAELMDTVGLARRYAFSYPHELDGGRRQRIGIARALAVNPKFIVCDEPVSALDVSIQAQILNLMQDLQEEKGLTYMFITHDLSVVRHISHSILVMYLGCQVEMCPSKELFDRPLHPYTKGLLSAIPIPSIHVDKPQSIISGEVTSPVNPKPGCRFSERCPYTKELCREKLPEFSEVLPGHFCACHFCGEINKLTHAGRS